MLTVLALPPKRYVRLDQAPPTRLTRLRLDFMVRLSVKRLPSPRTGSKRPSYILVPDGLQHPKFKGLDSRKGHYVVCRRAAMEEFDGRGAAFILTLKPC
jgi:hypothetical protein